jgi:hypothetical protein
MFAHLPSSVPRRNAVLLLSLALVRCTDSSSMQERSTLSAGDRPEATARPVDATTSEPSSTIAPAVSDAGTRNGEGPPESEPEAPALPGDMATMTPVDVEVPIPRPVASSSEQVVVSDAGSVALPADDAGAPSTEVDTTSPEPGNGSGGNPSSAASAPGFSIELSFEDDSMIEGNVLDAFIAAKERWERVIVGDLSDVAVSDKASCAGHDLPESVDDVVIFVKASELDGPRGLLGAAGPCAIRSRLPRLPFASVVEFDVADLEQFAEEGRLEEVVLHEMGHAIGLGSLWEEFGLVDEPSDGTGEADTAFNGEGAREAFETLTGGTYEGNAVPVENVGTDGEINGHWRESVMGNELMTTRMGSNVAALSVITLAALQDMGYVVDFAEAEEYTWPSEDGNFAFLRVGTHAPVSEIDLSRDVLILPLMELAEDGRLVPARRP